MAITANATGIGWEDAFERASAFVSKLTLEEKVRMVTGTAGPCVGNIGPVSRLGFNGICLQDGPLAIMEASYASVFPAGLTTAASWDRRLAHVRGQDMADEFVGKGAHVALGPVAGPLGRSGYGGRNWEGFSPDPFLTGELFAETIVGMEEQGIQACAKRGCIRRHLSRTCTDLGVQTTWATSRRLSATLMSTTMAIPSRLCRPISMIGLCMRSSTSCIWSVFEKPVLTLL